MVNCFSWTVGATGELTGKKVEPWKVQPWDVALCVEKGMPKIYVITMKPCQLWQANLGRVKPIRQVGTRKVPTNEYWVIASQGNMLLLHVTNTKSLHMFVDGEWRKEIEVRDMPQDVVNMRLMQNILIVGSMGTERDQGLQLGRYQLQRWTALLGPRRWVEWLLCEYWRESHRHDEAQWQEDSAPLQPWQPLFLIM